MTQWCGWRYDSRTTYGNYNELSMGSVQRDNVDSVLSKVC